MIDIMVLFTLVSAEDTPSLYIKMKQLKMEYHEIDGKCACGTMFIKFDTVRDCSYLIQSTQNQIITINRYLIQIIRQLLCNALIQPHFDNVCSKWYPKLTNYLKNRIYSTQNKCICSIIYQQVNVIASSRLHPSILAIT